MLDIVLWGLVFVLLGISAILGWIVLPVVLILDFQIWQDATPLERKEVLQRLLKRVDVDGKQIVNVCQQEDSSREVLQACASSDPITIGF